MDAQELIAKISIRVGEWCQRMILQKVSTRNWTTVSTVVVATATVASTTAVLYWIHQLVARYGWVGSLNLIWEGSPYPPRIRDRMETLDDVQCSSESNEAEIVRLEAAYQQAQSDVSEASRESATSESIIIKLWEEKAACKDLRLALASLSDTLDKLAARVDATPSEGETDVKDRKKALSNALVLLMDRIDRLVHCFKATSERFEC